MKYKKARWVKSILPVINEVKKLFNDFGINCEICGAIRRHKKWVMNVIVVVDKSILTVVNTLCFWDKSIKFLNNPYTAKTRIVCVIKDIQFCFYTADDKCWGAVILYCTGSIRFNAVLSSIAKSFGMRLTARGLYYGELLIAGKTEKQIFEALGMNYIKPKLRNTKKDWVGEMTLMRKIKKKGGF